MKLSTKVNAFTREDVVDLLSLIISDIEMYGMNLHFDNARYDYCKGIVLARKDEEQICYEDVLAELMYHDFLYVDDCNEENTLLLDYEKIVKGIELGISKGWVNVDSSEWDAQDGMNVLQCALFGDIIYG